MGGSGPKHLRPLPAPGWERLARQIDAALWNAVQARWAQVGIPGSVMLVLDSTVVQRYGLKQAGAEKGYNPTKKGRPSHHPLVAFLAETGDCMGVIWRPGSAHTAAGAIAWIQLLVERLRSAGVREITLRLDKGFFSREMVEALEALGVGYVLKVPDHGWVRSRLSSYRNSAKDEGIWSASGTMYGARLLSIQQREAVDARGEELALESERVRTTAHVLTNLEGIHAVTAWRLYNRGALVEQRIEELNQLSVGETAVDDLGGNHLLWAMGALAYQVLHTIRTTALSGRWRVAQPKRKSGRLWRSRAWALKNDPQSAFNGDRASPRAHGAGLGEADHAANRTFMNAAYSPVQDPGSTGESGTLPPVPTQGEWGRAYGHLIARFTESELHTAHSKKSPGLPSQAGGGIFRWVLSRDGKGCGAEVLLLLPRLNSRRG